MRISDWSSDFGSSYLVRDDDADPFSRAVRGLNDTVLIAAEGQELPALLSQDNPVICAETGATDLAIFGEAGSPVERWLPLCDPPQHEAGDDEADQCTPGERFQPHGLVPIIPEEPRHLEKFELGAGEAQVDPGDDRRDEEGHDDPDRDAEGENGAPFRLHDALPDRSRSRSSGTSHRPSSSAPRRRRGS